MRSLTCQVHLLDVWHQMTSSNYVNEIFFSFPNPLLNIWPTKSVYVFVCARHYLVSFYYINEERRNEKKSKREGFNFDIYIFFNAVERKIRQDIFFCWWWWCWEWIRSSVHKCGSKFIAEYYQWPSNHDVYVRQDKRHVYRLNMFHVYPLNRMHVWQRTYLHLEKNITMRNSSSMTFSTYHYRRDLHPMWEHIVCLPNSHWDVFVFAIDWWIVRVLYSLEPWEQS